MIKYIKGRIKEIYKIIPNPDCYWFTGKLKVNGQKDLISFAGTVDLFPVIGVAIEGDMLLDEHPKYGIQYNNKKLELAVCPLTDKTSFVNYLSSGVHRNLGKMIADRLWSDWGLDVWSAILNNSDGVRAKSGVSSIVMNDLIKLAKDRDEATRLIAVFPSLRRKAARRIMADTPGSFDMVVDLIKENPYSMVEVSGVTLSDMDAVYRNDLHGDLSDKMRMYYLVHAGVKRFMDEYNATYVNVSDMYECYQAVECKNRGVMFNKGSLLYLIQHAEGLPVADGFNMTSLCNLLLDFDLHAGAYPDKLRFISVPVQRDGKLVNECRLYTTDMWLSKEIIETVMSEQAMMSLFPDKSEEYEARDKLFTARLKELYANPKFLRPNREQRDALHNVFLNKMSVISGGPGRGKTAIVSLLVNIWQSIYGENTVLCLGPTGCAVKRMREIMFHDNIETLARMLVMSGSSLSLHKTEPEYGRSKVKAVDGINEFVLSKNFLIVVDETSMVNFVNAGNFLGIAQRATIVFVGDVNQLPPIGQGAFLRELIASDVIPVTYLKKNMRAKVPELVDFADAIADGTFDPFSMKRTNNFWWQKCDSEADTQEAILSHYGNLLKQVDFSDIMVLSPKKDKSPVAVDRLNALLQDRVNPVTPSASIMSKDNERFSYQNGNICHGFEVSVSNEQCKACRVSVRVGDRIMNTRNDLTRTLYRYDDDDLRNKPYKDGEGLYNGDTGKIVRYFYGKPGRLRSILVRMDDGSYVDVNESEFVEWKLAYAMTVHKAQGSEAKHVILVLPYSSNGCRSVLVPFYNRHMIYVACTRAKESVTMLGSMQLLDEAVKSVPKHHNNTKLEVSI